MEDKDNMKEENAETNNPEQHEAKNNSEANQPTYEQIKEKEQKELQANNLIEEASEIVSTCIKCGECKGLCPVFKSMRLEDVSPRGHATMLSEKTIRESLFLCTMCKACEARCPMNIKVCDAVAKAREALALRDQGKTSHEETTKELENIGNPFVKKNH